jgi:hypothetical protein
MNWKTSLIALAFGAAAATMVAQEAKTTTQKETTTQQNPDGSMQTQTTTRTTTVTGSVVKYTPGQTLVLKSTDGKETTYAIGSSIEVPAEVQVGKRVTISTEPASDGSGPAMVTRFETTSVDSQGQMKKTTEKTEVSASGQTTKSTQTTVYGTVTAYEPGQSITIERPGQQTVTYTVTSESQLPQDLAVGKSVTVSTSTMSGSTTPLARRVTYRTMTKTTKEKTVNPQ